jgi:amino acid adenylation domain-containing protein
MTLLGETLPDLFAARAKLQPGAVALVQGDRTVTFAALDSQSNRLARHLQRRGVGPQDVVGLCIERSIEAVTSALAIMKLGATFLPLDPEYPPERLRLLVDDSQAPFAVTCSALTDLFQATSTDVISLQASEAAIRAEDDSAISLKCDGEDIAYVIYTSGSTGRPVGVMTPHRAALNRFRWMWKAFPFTDLDVACHKTSLSFVDSVWEIFGALLGGIRLVIAPRSMLRLVDCLAAEKVTRIVLVPSLLAQLLASYPNLRSRVPRLNLWIASGEPLVGALVQEFRRLMPEARLLNLYGSSEVSADATWFDTALMPASATRVPIGRPIDNVTVHVLDENRLAVAPGEIGELYVGGMAVARGYHRRPTLTEARFIPDPFSEIPGGMLFKTGDRGRLLASGDLDFLGRSDRQVKVRGNRLELDEVEATLAQHPAVQHCAAGVRQAGPLGGELIAWVVPRASDAAVRAPDLAGFLAERLPRFMVPDRFQFVSALPLGPTGKLDWRNLEMPARQDGDAEASVNPQ